MDQIKILRFGSGNVSWFSAVLNWKIRVPDQLPYPRVIVTEESLDSSYVLYRGTKRYIKVTGLAPRTLYNYKLTVIPRANKSQDEMSHTTDETQDKMSHDNKRKRHFPEARTSFSTLRCGEHDASLIAAIQDHDLLHVREICRRSPEVVNIVDRTAQSPIMIASQRGYPSILRILYDNGGNVNYCNPSGKTALMLAAYYGNCHVIPTLMELGCDWDIKDNAGCTAIHYAIERGDIEMCTVLSEMGADIRCEDSRGASGLISLCLADREQLEMIKFLVKRGEDINLASATGETPLMAAARTGKADVVQFLIDSGANVHSRTHYGYTAFEMCQQGSTCEEVLAQYPEPVESDED